MNDSSFQRLELRTPQNKEEKQRLIGKELNVENHSHLKVHQPPD